jgi:hypothetical protein
VFNFTEDEKGLSSGHRELLSVKKALYHWKNQDLMKNRRIYWATDSTNVVSFLNKGSSKPHIQRDLFEIVGKLMELKSDVIAVHLSRSDERIVLADELSKREDSDDWSMDSLSFSQLRREYNLQVDVFASEFNARLDRFFTQFYNEKSEGTNAFAQVWREGLFLCPPVKMLPAICSEIRRRIGCEGIIIVPIWPTASFYSLFFEKDEPKWPFRWGQKIKLFIYQNQGAKGALCGKLTFELAVLYFDKRIK